MRIVYVITRGDAVGGATIHVRDLARAMRERGHDAQVIVGGTGAVTEQLAAAGVPFHALESLRRAVRPLRDWRALAEIESALRRLRPDVVSTHTAKAGWLGRAACARLRIPCLFTPHGWSMGPRLGAGGRLFTAAERLAARWADAIVCVCEYERGLAIERGVGRPEQLHVIYNGVADVPEPLRANPGAAPVRICSLARFEPPKDHATLLRALASLEGAEWTLDLIGDGSLQPQARRLAESLGIAGRVRFLDYVADPAPALGAAQMFVLSSRSEALPRSILEAMRAGLPVIASDVGGVREAVDEVVPAEDPRALTAALRRYLLDPALRRERGAAMRRSYEQRFTFDRMAAETEALYATVLHRASESQVHAPTKRS